MEASRVAPSDPAARYSGALARLEHGRSDPAAAADLAKAAVECGREEEALPVVERVAADAASATLWQWTGVLARAADDAGRAHAAFDRAAALSPNSPRIVQGQAQTALEAGYPASALFAQALVSDPVDGAMLQGRAAALIAEGQAVTALQEIDRTLAHHPGWHEGHRLAAQLRWMTGDRPVTRSLTNALRQAPRDPGLWTTLIAIRMQAQDHEGALAAIGDARAAGVRLLDVAAWEGACQSELGDRAAADRAFARLADPADPRSALFMVRHLLRAGRIAEAARIAEQAAARPGGTPLWPYLDVAWRLLDDRRHEWLFGDPQLIGTIDLSAVLPLAELAEVLRGLHALKTGYFDQSVRGGTQTDGPLFRRAEPEIRLLRAALVDAVRAYVAQLPAVDPRHPVLFALRDRPVRFSGSWSVRLAGGGRHVAHVHPEGWLSSALYIAVPAADDTPHAGWLELGAPPEELGLDLAPRHLIEPQPGRLALFPSLLWHGTRPFAQGERMTVAFDVAHPI
jgi:tetratricopeptide (TPR) repeat protein